MDRTPLFLILRNSLLSLVMCFCVACAARNEAGAACPTIEMRAAANPQTDSTPLVATSDITGATASQSGDQWAVNFTVTDGAAARVHEFSKQQVGSNLALVVDGKVHGTPRIAAAIVGNSYQIDGFSRANAEQLATAITNGCHR